VAGLSGLFLQRELSRRRVDVPTVLLTAYGDVSMAVEAMKNGALDFLEKPVGADKLLACVERAIAYYLGSRKQRLQREEVETQVRSLSRREKDVLELLLEGRNIKTIAAQLGIGPQTVAKHRSKILKNLDVRGDAELVRRVYLVE
jgi:FixJ family two-component response regulator